MIDTFTPTVLITLIAVAALLLLWLRADNDPAPAPAPVTVAAEDPCIVNRPRSAAPLTCEGSVGRLSTPQLCRTLRLSYPPPPEDTAFHDIHPLTPWDLVQIRASLLDEIERRDPDGFSRWLATMPTPGGDPTSYLTPGR